MTLYLGLGLGFRFALAFASGQLRSFPFSIATTFSRSTTALFTVSDIRRSPRLDIGWWSLGWWAFSLQHIMD